MHARPTDIPDGNRDRGKQRIWKQTERPTDGSVGRKTTGGGDWTMFEVVVTCSSHVARDLGGGSRRGIGQGIGLLNAV